MKNKYEIRGDVVVLFLDYREEITTALFSTVDLPRVKAVPGKWYAMNVGGKHREKWYVGTRLHGATLYLHQLIIDNPPHTVVDHVNHDPFDNRRQNLRIASYSQNGQNRRGAQRNNRSTGLRNVYQSRSGNYFVQLRLKGKNMYFGTYPSLEEANRRAILSRRIYFPFYFERKSS